MNVAASLIAPQPAAAISIAHKFGGSSLADAGRMRHVAQLLRDRVDGEQIVVVSAMHGVTDALIGLTPTRAAANLAWRPQWEKVHTRHIQTARDLLGARAQPTLDWLDANFNELGRTAACAFRAARRGQ